MTRFTVQASSTRRRARCVGFTATTTLTAAAAPQTAWQRVLSQVRPDGSVSEQTAREAFVLAIGPLPGVRGPAGSAQVIEDGSGAVRWLLGYSGLTAAQRAAMRRLLRLPVTASRQPAESGAPGPLTGTARSGASRGTGSATLAAITRPAAAASPAPGNLAADQAPEQQAAAEISSRLGMKLTLRRADRREPDAAGTIQGPGIYRLRGRRAGLWTTTAPAAQCTMPVRASRPYQAAAPRTC